MIKFLRKLVLWLLIIFFGSSIGMVFVYKYLPVYITPLMVIRLFDQHQDGKPLRLKHTWVPMEKINNSLPLAVWASEDQRFFSHKGFDLKEIDNAVKERNNGGRQRGASTITQQTAKNVFLSPAQTWLRKGLEAYFTTLIELIWDKQRIMEVYLNSIEMGDGIYGAQAAAKAHFGHDAATLSKEESALIAAALPSPLKRSCTKPGPYMQQRQKEILRQMKLLGGRFPEDK
jgi:monofunctional biosynthetic peptidoglycan transglycosylase